jgi:hypothetical protein
MKNEFHENFSRWIGQNAEYSKSLIPIFGIPP